MTRDWLRLIERPHYIVNQLCKSSLIERFPVEALRFLDIVLVNQPWAPPESGQCLSKIAQTLPHLIEDSQYKPLNEYFRRHNI